MTKFAKATAKGQITIPAAWRKILKTDQFLLNFKNNKIILEPVEISKISTKGLSLKEIIAKETKKSDLVIFDAYRDNKGEGIEAEKILKILKEIDG